MDNKEEKEKLRIVETIAKRMKKKDGEQDEPGEEAAMLEEANGDDENETEKDEEIELSASLTENTYSIIYVADPKSWAFYFGIAFFLFQTALPVLALIGLLGKYLKAAYSRAANIATFGPMLICLIPKTWNQIIFSRHQQTSRAGSVELDI
jgi:hypothetical protein